MITITYSPVYSIVSSHDKQELHLADSLLSKELTFEVPGYIFSPQYNSGLWDGRKTFYQTNKHRFLSGLTSKVLRILSGAEFEVQINKYPEPWKYLDVCTNPISLWNVDDTEIYTYDYQLNAVQKILKYNRGIVKVATNGGKTEVMAAVLKVLGFPQTICLVPRKELLYQTQERLKLRLRQDIGIVGDGVWAPSMGGVTVAMFQTLARRKSSSVTRWLQKTEVLFGDECHFLSDTQYQNTFTSIPAPIRVGMSGTPFKDNIIDEMTVRGVVGPVLCTVGNKELIERGVSVKPKIVFLEPAVPFIEAKSMEWGTWDTTLYNCEQRNKLIGNLAYGFVKSGRQTVVMVTRVEHGKRLQRYIPNSILTHSQASNRKQVKERLVSGEVFCCICTSIFDTGLSVDYMEALIMAGGGNASHTLLQRLGRLLRRSSDRVKDVYCVDFWDTFNKITRSHSRDRWEIFKNENAFDMLEGPDDLPADVLTEVLEGAGVARNKVRKSQKAKFKS